MICEYKNVDIVKAETLLLQMMDLYEQDVYRYVKMKDLCSELTQICKHKDHNTASFFTTSVIKLLLQFQIITMDRADVSDIHIIDYLATPNKNNLTEPNNIKYVVTPLMTLGHLGMEDNVFVFSSTENEFVDYTKRTCKNIESNELLITI